MEKQDEQAVQNLGEGRLKELPKEENRALLVGTYEGGKEKKGAEEQLEELENLAETYGLEVEEKIVCPIRKIDASTYIGKGKVEEISELVREKKINIVIFDHEIAPHQQRNLEKEFVKPVIDRTELILGVFAQRAQTKEAQIQIDLARYRYQFPRLVRMWTHLSRERTGGGATGGYLRGAGEKQIEVDRRILKAKIAKLQGELQQVRKQRTVQKKARVRQGVPTFAIIGYTNAGKSTLLKALTDADVLIEDKLFATLDTTTRKFSLPNKQEILLIDTVGFIRKIPHGLVAAFKSTLEEAVQADILLHLIDASSFAALEQAEATKEVLRELEAEKRPMITVLNKIDRCEDRSMIQKLKIKFSKTVEISALKKEGFSDLYERMMDEISRLRKVVRLKIPQSEYSLVSQLMGQGNVISCEYEGNDILLEVEIPHHIASKVELYRI